MPTLVSGIIPWYRCRSEPQIAATVTRTIASLGCSIGGMSFSSTRTRYGPRYTIARMSAPHAPLVVDSPAQSKREAERAAAVPTRRADKRCGGATASQPVRELHGPGSRQLRGVDRAAREHEQQHLRRRPDLGAGAV